MNGMANDGARQLADAIIFRALQLMQDEGVPFAVMMERLLTVAGAHLASANGSEHAAHVFREATRSIEAGELARVERRASSH